MRTIFFFKVDVIMRIEKNTQSNVISRVSLLRNTKRNYNVTIIKNVTNFLGSCKTNAFKKICQ